MMKILVVDDHAVDRFLLTSLLNTLLPQIHITADIQEAECGIEAVDECHTTKYDIIFMDIIMPKLDGIQATRQIREFDSNAVIIGMSSEASSPSQIEMIQNGGDHFIEKPVYGDTLIPILRGVITQIEKRHKKH